MTSAEQSKAVVLLFIHVLPPIALFSEYVKPLCCCALPRVVFR